MLSKPHGGTKRRFLKQTHSKSESSIGSRISQDAFLAAPLFTHTDDARSKRWWRNHQLVSYLWRQADFISPPTKIHRIGDLRANKQILNENSSRRKSKGLLVLASPWMSLYSLITSPCEIPIDWSDWMMILKHARKPLQQDLTAHHTQQFQRTPTAPTQTKTSTKNTVSASYLLQHTHTFPSIASISHCISKLHRL